MLTIFATAASFIYFWTIYDDGLHLLSSARHEKVAAYIYCKLGVGLEFIM